MHSNSNFPIIDLIVPRMLELSDRSTSKPLNNNINPLEPQLRQPQDTFI
jgi:hypothetical protein